MKENFSIEFKDGKKISVDPLFILKDFMVQAVLKVDRPEEDIIAELKQVSKNLKVGLTDKEFMKEYKKVKRATAPIRLTLKAAGRKSEKEV